MIALADPEDAGGIARLESWLARHEDPTNIPERTAIWRSRLTRNPRSVLILREGAEIVGFARVEPTGDDPDRVATILDFAVEPGRRSTDRGAALWAAVRQWLVSQEWHAVRVGIAEADPLRDFFLEMGFAAEEGRGGGAGETVLRLVL